MEATTQHQTDINTTCPWCKNPVPLSEVVSHKEVCESRPHAKEEHFKNNSQPAK